MVGKTLFKQNKMKKYIYLFMSLSVLFFYGCEDNREDDLPGDTFYIARNGITEEVSYNTGEEAVLNLWTYRSGLNGASASVEYVLNENLITEYNAKEGTSLKVLPADCYTISQKNLNISGDERYAKFAVTYYPEKIENLAGYGLSDYVLPFEIKVLGQTIGKEDGDKALVQFEVRQPLVKFSKIANDVVTIISTDPQFANSDYTPIAVDFENKWDISINISNDSNLVKAYNTANNKNFLIMPENAYTLEPASPVLKAGEQVMNIRYQIDRTKLKLGNNYLLPVKIESVSKFDPDPSSNIRYIEVEYVDAIIPQTNWEIYDYRDFQSGDGDGPGALIDNNIDTYWHANWSNGSQLPSWITIKLTDMSKALTITQVDLYARQGNTGGPKTVEIKTSMDGVNFELAGTLAFKSVKTVQKVVFATPMKARYVMMNITEKNNNSVAMGEMYVRGVFDE